MIVEVHIEFKDSFQNYWVETIEIPIPDTLKTPNIEAYIEDYVNTRFYTIAEDLFNQYWKKKYKDKMKNSYEYEERFQKYLDSIVFETDME